MNSVLSFILPIAKLLTIIQLGKDNVQNLEEAGRDVLQCNIPWVRNESLQYESGVATCYNETSHTMQWIQFTSSGLSSLERMMEETADDRRLAMEMNAHAVPSSQPTNAPVAATTTDECNGLNQELFQISLQTDQYGEETYWELYDDDRNYVWEGGSNNDYEPNTEYDHYFCLSSSDSQCYTFTIYDELEDGMEDQGYYSGIMNDEEIFSGSEFKKKASHHFCLTPPNKRCDGPGQESFQLTLQMDDYGDETSWELIDDTRGIVVERGGDFKENTEYKEQFCLLSKRCYTFNIYDVLGDGLCCDEGRGFYSGFLGYQELFSGDEFGEKASHSFCVH